MRSSSGDAERRWRDRGPRRCTSARSDAVARSDRVAARWRCQVDDRRRARVPVRGCESRSDLRRSTTCGIAPDAATESPGAAPPARDRRRDGSRGRAVRGARPRPARGTISTRPPSEPRARDRHAKGPNRPMPITEAAVLDALRTVQEPELGRRHRHAATWSRTSTIDGTRVAFTIELTTPACPLKDEIEARRQRAVLEPHRRRGGRHHLGRHGPPGRSRARPSSSSRASRTSSPSRRARAASARARSASTWPSRWPRRAPRSACSTPTSPARTSR